MIWQDEVEVGVAVGVGVATGLGFAAPTPLAHTSFFPLFTHVYFLPADTDIFPIFLQVSPAFRAAAAFNGAIRANTRVRAKSVFFMGRVSRNFARIAINRSEKNLI